MVETRGSRRFAIFFLAAAFALLLLGRWLQPVDDVMLTIYAPFGSVVNSVATIVGNAVTGLVQGPRLETENEQLKNKLALLLRQNTQMQDAKHENVYLKTLLKFDGLNNHTDFFTARVIMSDPNVLHGNVIINAGSANGLRPGMTVISQGSYFLGTIVQVAPRASKVQLLTNPSSTVGAYDLQTRAQAVVTGQFNGLPQLRFIQTSALLRVGDWILTSGQANLFPRGILLGQIVAVHRHSYDQFQTADIRPATDFGNMEVVQVVRNHQPRIPFSLLQSP